MSVFHAGEQAVQERAGVRAMAERVGPIISAEMPEAAQDFLKRQPFVIVGYADPRSRVWASVLAGAPGFAFAADGHTVELRAEPRPGDPLQGVWQDGTEVGLLAIELSTCCRMRINGTLARRAGGVMTVAVRQAYANCPKYIQRRDWEQNAAPLPASPPSRHRTTLSQAQQRWIAQSDTFFIASAHAEAGADASHRGGAPGFVRVDDDATLTFPDYSGNNMFNTLGNLALNPRAGLLFIDFASGDTLQLTGDAKIVWDADRAAPFPGAQRVVEFTVTSVIETRQSIALHWRFLEASPNNPA